MDGSLEIQFLVSSNSVQIKDVQNFRTGLKITNNGLKSIKIDISNAEIYVNNKKNRAWDLRVQNGTIINLKVPAKQSKTVQWSLGKALFKSPGIYELELRWESMAKKQKVIVSD